MNRLHAVKIFGIGSVIATSGVHSRAALAQALPCPAVHELEHRVAVAAADTWLSARWSKKEAFKTAFYELKIEPPHPLGLGKWRKPLDGDNSSPLATDTISGQARVSRFSCTTYEIATNRVGRRFVVRFTGGALQFNENAKGWTRPVPIAVVHVLEVLVTGDAGAAPVISDLPEALSALPPDIHLLVR